MNSLNVYDVSQFRDGNPSMAPRGLAAVAARDRRGARPEVAAYSASSRS